MNPDAVTTRDYRYVISFFIFMFTTYILYSASLDNYYIGFTGDDITTRLLKHLSDHKGYTGKAKDWMLVHTEKFVTKQEAMKREKQLKGWKNKNRIMQLISRSSSR